MLFFGVNIYIILNETIKSPCPPPAVFKDCLIYNLKWYDALSVSLTLTQFCNNNADSHEDNAFYFTLCIHMISNDFSIMPNMYISWPNKWLPKTKSP